MLSVVRRSQRGGRRDASEQRQRSSAVVSGRQTCSAEHLLVSYRSVYIFLITNHWYWYVVWQNGMAQSDYAGTHHVLITLSRIASPSRARLLQGSPAAPSPPSSTSPPRNVLSCSECATPPQSLRLWDHGWIVPILARLLRRRLTFALGWHVRAAPTTYVAFRILPRRKWSRPEKWSADHF